MNLQRKIIFPILLLVLLMLSGCSTVGYYSQAVRGHLKLMAAKEPIDALLKSEDTDPELRKKLQTLVDARVYAVDRLKLPENDSYDSYSATGRRYVTWNVVAAEEFALRARTWCFPVAGCVSYRGYFAEEDARAYAANLAKESYDVTVGGASAYSTLGWFEDPVLDTMLSGGEISYVGTMFHELAHQLLYIKDDSNFNEAFASFVQQEGIRTWLSDREESDRIGRYDAWLARGDDFSGLLKQTRGELLALYRQTLDEDTMRSRKQQVFTDMRENYATLKSEKWNGYSGYDGWFKRDLNNARLLAVATYRRFVPAFAVMFEEAGNDFEAFYALAKKVAELPASERAKRMEAYLEQAARAS